MRIIMIIDNIIDINVSTITIYINIINIAYCLLSCCLFSWVIWNISNIWQYLLHLGLKKIFFGISPVVNASYSHSNLAKLKIKLKNWKRMQFWNFWKLKTRRLQIWIWPIGPEICILMTKKKCLHICKIARNSKTSRFILKMLKYTKWSFSSWVKRGCVVRSFT